jgi:hypothetical protein
MAYKFRGEVEIESGLGLPTLTTTERLAYVPLADGYAVFDTDLKQICAWDIDELEWVVGVSVAQMDDKIDVLDGIGTNTLTIQTASDVDAIKFTAEVPAVVGDVGFDASLTNNGSGFELINNDTEFWGTGSYITIQTQPSTHQTSGKWYWETFNGNDVGSATVSRGSGITNSATLASTLWIGDSGGTFDSYGAWGYNGSAYTEGAVIASLGIFNQPGQVLRHKLDLDSGIYEMAVDGGSFIIIEDTASRFAGKTWAPSVTSRNSSNIIVALPESNWTYAAPSGFLSLSSGTGAVGISTRQEFFVGGLVASELYSTEDALTIVFGGGASLAIQSDHTLTNLPIRGVDGTDPSSLITKAYVDAIVIDGEFIATFATGDWTVGSPSTYVITQATHGVPHTSGGSQRVTVQELAVGIYQNVDVETEVDTTTGDVTLKTVGAVFDGRVFIS